MESILRLERFVTSITIWVPFRVTQLFGAIKESLRSRVFVPPSSFDYGIV